MKSKLTRIMGVALALVLVCSLGVAFMPSTTPAGPETAEAADLGWSTMPIPSTTSNVIVGNNEDLGPVAISPNFTADNTVWAVVNDATVPAAARPIVYKSTNGGHTWVATTSNLGGVGDVGVALVPSPTYATDNSIFVAIQQVGGAVGGARVYRSTNGGSSFGQLGVVTTAANEVITSMDIAPNYDGTGTLAIGIADRRPANQTTLANCVQIWGMNSVLSWVSLAPAAASAGVDVTALIYSPNYVMDSTILVVTSDAGTNAGGDMATVDPYLRLIVGGTWDGLVGATQVNGAGAGTITDYDETREAVVSAIDIMSASIAVPQDYNSQISTTRRAYVSIVSEGAVAATVSNVYRITNVTAGSPLATAAAIKIDNLQYRGTFAEGTLLGTLFAAAQADVYRTTNPTQSVVNWYGVSGVANQPSGTLLGATANTTAWIAMSTDYVNDTTLVVGTQGNESAFGYSTNGAVSFNETGLIEGANANLTTLMDIGLSPNYVNDSTMFLTSNLNSATANNIQTWVTTNGGSYWDRCWVATWTTPVGVIAASDEYASNATVYVGDQTGTAIFYTANGGQSWSGRTAGIAIQTLAAPDATTVYVGESAGTGRIGKSTNSGWTWPTAMRKATGCAASVMSLKVKDSTLVVGGNAGTVRRSDDGGATWAKVSATIVVGNMYVDFDGTTVYAAVTGTGQVYRSVDGAAWTTLTMPTAVAGVFAPLAAVELILAEDGTLYMLDSTAVTAATVDSVWRSINPTAAQPTPGTTWQNMVTIPAAATALNLSVVSGTNILAVLIDTAGGATANSLRMYNDTLSASSAAPNLVSPADGSTLSRGQAARFILEAMPKVTAYTIWWSTDSTFGTTPAAQRLAVAAPATSNTAALTEGATVYWKARATAPFNSPWSEVWTVETQITTAVQAPVPAYPAGDDVMDIALKPVFNWGAFKYASGYEFQMANDSGMTDLIVDLSGANALGNVTSFVLETSLDYDSAYYWRVRAIKGTGTAYSDWSAIVGFVTVSKTVVAPDEPAPIVIPPTPVTPPTTPAYVWAIIAIGAVLVITVIVLIVRTRRIA